MQGLPQSRSDLRIAPSRPYDDQRLQNQTPSPYGHPAGPRSTVSPTSPTGIPMVQTQSYPVAPSAAPLAPGAPTYPQPYQGQHYGPSHGPGHHYRPPHQPHQARAAPEGYGAERRSRPRRPDSVYPSSMRGAAMPPPVPSVPTGFGAAGEPRTPGAPSDAGWSAPQGDSNGHPAPSGHVPSGHAPTVHAPSGHAPSVPTGHAPNGPHAQSRPRAPSGPGPAHYRPPPLSMPRVPSEPIGLRVDASEAPLRIARARPSPSQPPPIPTGAREQILAQTRADTLHSPQNSNSSDAALSVYDHYDEPSTPISPQSRTLPRTGPTQSGFLSRSVSAAQATKPAPASSSSDLSIEQFESVRKHAASQPHDPRAQLELAKKLWEAADSLANRYLDPLRPSTMEVDERTQARNREAWSSQAIKIAKPLVTKTRNPDAMFFLGSLYSTGGNGIEKDYVKALDYYHRAAQLDHTDSCYRIAVCEEFGVGTRRDFEKALSWYHKAAVLGSVASMYKLGMLSLLGSVDQKRDFRTGMVWLQRAADHADAQNPHALHELGLLYEHSPLSTYQTSDPLPQNDAKALEKFYVAAKLGYAPSQSRLGRAFEFGELGCSIDPNWSISWYTQAAKQRDSDAELALAGWYWTGSPGILKKSETEAFLWAERSAGHGNPRALFTVGYFYECGIGVPKDIDKARRWYTKAAEKKHHRAAERLREMVEASS